VRLTAARTDLPPADLEASVRDVLDRRLSASSRRPLAVALSGGGDSLALALIAARWARDVGRPLLVLTLDHGLQTQSHAWTQACGATAQRLGASFRGLAWEGRKPTAGLPAAARAARHALLADAAREAGARVLLMGHTADDTLEAQAMRAAGATTPGPREWSPSPAWPQGRDLFLLRPLLGVRRVALRDWLAARGERWIDDPANDDLRYARVRARKAGVDGEPTAADDEPLELARLCHAQAGGGLAIPRQALREAAPQATRRFLALASVCAGGGARRPATERLARVAALCSADGPFTATLAGARIEADDADVRFWREAGEAARGGLSPLRLAAGETGVWDGRFEFAADAAVEIRTLAGLASRLPRDQRRDLLRLPAAARGGLPVVVVAGEPGCPVLAPAAGLAFRPLTYERLRAAAGLVEREADQQAAGAD
jgi:tRNA(Ile)-lysidine synthase